MLKYMVFILIYKLILIYTIIFGDIFNLGIVSNQVYDPRINVRMNLLTGSTASDPFWWNSTEPIWVTARKKVNYISIQYNKLNFHFIN